MNGGNPGRAQRVYDWERTFVEPGDVSFLSRGDCVALAAAAARLLGIHAPAMRFPKSARTPCWASPAEWSLSISDWGRTRVTVLHEMAHLGAAARGAFGEDPHGPTFLRCAIDLYSSMLGFAAHSLEEGAAKFGLAPAPDAAPPRSRPADRESFFDGEF